MSGLDSSRMSGENLDGKPDVTIMPNFSALGDWMVKLRSWCEHACDRLNFLERDVEEKAKEIDRLEQELSEARRTDEDYEEARAYVEDTLRGIRTMDELANHFEIRR